jgi:hypothetical protein
MDSTYKMSQTDLHEFAIHEKSTGTLQATITRESSGAWSTNPHEKVLGDPAPAFEEQKTPQAAFNAFIEWASGPDDDSD